MRNHPQVVVFGRDTLSTRVIASALSDHFETCVLVERTPPVIEKLKTRVRLFGWRRACGQILFQLLSPALAMRQKRRRRELQEKLEANIKDFCPRAVVKSINSARARATLRRLNPDLMVLSGTRIVGKSTLSTVPITVNMHVGITPQYRGVHGGYWAMVEGDLANVGVTIHKVDLGVDTGQVLKQVRVAPSTDDGFFTLPLMQLQAGIEPLVDIVGKVLAGTTYSHQSNWNQNSMGKQWFHPTLYEYLRNGLTRGIW